MPLRPKHLLEARPAAGAVAGCADRPAAGAAAAENVAAGAGTATSAPASRPLRHHQVQGDSEGHTQASLVSSGGYDAGEAQESELCRARPYLALRASAPHGRQVHARAPLHLQACIYMMCCAPNYRDRGTRTTS